jgi:hypothetical protein
MYGHDADNEFSHECHDGDHDGQALSSIGLEYQGILPVANFRRGGHNGIMSVNAISPLRMERDLYLSRIGRVVDDLMEQEEIFRECLHHPNIILEITDQMKKLPLETFLAIEEHEFRQCVGKLMASQLVDGIVDPNSICHKLNGGQDG